MNNFINYFRDQWGKDIERQFLEAVLKLSLNNDFISLFYSQPEISYRYEKWV